MEMVMDIARRSELLAAADRQPLLDLADRCLAAGPTPDVILAPEVGSVVLTVREPVEATRFHLGDVLVTRAEVRHRGERGWAMRMGADEAGALAAAICAAEAQAGGPLGAEVDDLCHATEQKAQIARAEEWRDLEPTIVSFEELEA